MNKNFSMDHESGKIFIKKRRKKSENEKWMDWKFIEKNCYYEENDENFKHIFLTWLALYSTLNKNAQIFMPFASLDNFLVYT